MIVQAIGLLDDLDKELNTYAMRVREWYGWHFPEMTRLVADNIKYAATVSRKSSMRGDALHSSELCTLLFSYVHAADQSSLQHSHINIPD